MVEAYCHPHALVRGTFDIEVGLRIFAQRLNNECADLSRNWPGHAFGEACSIVRDNNPIALPGRAHPLGRDRRRGTIGGIPFTRGPLGHLLRNRFYIGEVLFKGEVLPGEQAAIIDRDLFDAVQVNLHNQRTHHSTTRNKSAALLSGRIYDDRGNRMTPSHARKRGIRYRYYVSSSLLHGQAERAGSVRRVQAAEIETLVTHALREHCKDHAQRDDRDLIHSCLVRIEVRMEQLAVTVRTQGPAHELANGTDDADQPQPERTLLIPWQKTPSKRRREIIVPSSTGPQGNRPIRAETRAKLVASIARGRRWLDQIISGAVTDAETIATREQCSVRHLNMSISLAFLAPDLVKAATEGRLPRGIGVIRLCDGPPEWSRQRRILGLPTP